MNLKNTLPILLGLAAVKPACSDYSLNEYDPNRGEDTSMNDGEDHDFTDEIGTGDCMDFCRDNYNAFCLGIDALQEEVAWCRGALACCLMVGCGEAGRESLNAGERREYREQCDEQAASDPSWYCQNYCYSTEDQRDRHCVVRCSDYLDNTDSGML